MTGKRKYIIAALVATLAASSVFALAACQEERLPLTDEPLAAKVVADFTKTADDRNETFASGSKGYSWENGEPFDVWWKPENVTYENNKMSLAISEMTEKEQKWDEATETFVDVIADYYGAESRTEHYYGFGDFQVRMKPAAIVGTASTFFTCTGPYDKWYDEDGTTVKRENDHDEIDVEFLGKDTTKVQFNYFASGVGGHEYTYDLGFDASKEFHDYGFRWTRNDITWFVDLKPVYKVERKNIKSGEEWPEDPGRIIMNYWCGTENAQAWMGRFNNDYTGRAEYEWIKSSADEQPDPNTAHVKGPDPGHTHTYAEEWSKDESNHWHAATCEHTTEKSDEAAHDTTGDNGACSVCGYGAPQCPVMPPAEFSVPATGWEKVVDVFDGWEMYTLERLPYAYYNGVRLISKNTPIEYNDCCGMDLAKSYTYIKFAVKNEESEAADIRFDFKQKDVEKSGAVSAVMVNGKPAAILAEDNAIIVNVKANQVADVVIKLDSTKPINQMVIFLNSLKVENNPNSGRIIISDIIGVVNTEFSEAETPVAIPEDGWTNIAVDSFGDWEHYTVNKDGAVTISHDTARDDYACCGMDFDANYSWIKFTVTNNGTETAKLRFDIKDKSQDKNPSLVKGVYPVNAVALTKEMKDGKESKTASVIVESGKSADVTLELEASFFNQMVVFFNSLRDGNNAATGNVSISNFIGIVDPSIEHVDATKPFVAKLDFQRGESDRYSISNNNGTTTVTYNGIDKKSYQNIQANISEFAAQYNTLTLTITNNGSSESLIRIAVCKNTFNNKLDNPEICGVNGEKQQSSATEGINTDENSIDGKRGTFLKLPAGRTTTVTVKYDPGQGPKQLTIYMDSSYQEGGNADGNLTFTAISFFNT